jgi:hypothetical protein
MKYQYNSVLPINSIGRLGIFHSFMLFLLHFQGSSHPIYEEHQSDLAFLLGSL